MWSTIKQREINERERPLQRFSECQLNGLSTQTSIVIEKIRVPAEVFRPGRSCGRDGQPVSEWLGSS
eukprot:scaffold657_cov214-Amphora_coffeaeformis.AAC.5